MSLYTQAISILLSREAIHSLCLGSLNILSRQPVLHSQRTTPPPKPLPCPTRTPLGSATPHSLHPMVTLTAASSDSIRVMLHSLCPEPRKATGCAHPCSLVQGRGALSPFHLHSASLFFPWGRHNWHILLSLSSGVIDISMLCISRCDKLRRNSACPQICTS